ncbi:rod shape-determining protein MreC [Nocardioidaceae bacterium]|nr:rod shape-determining protein MreC [Nocardioidaceae bacterium]
MSPRGRRPGRPRRTAVDRKRGGAVETPSRRPAIVAAALLAAGFGVVTLDARAEGDSPLDPARDVLADVVAPAQEAVAAGVRPLASLADGFSSRTALQDEIRALQAENAELRGALVATDVDAKRVAEVDALLATSGSTGYDVVGARVVAMGGAQSFNQTVTIDTGRSSGVRPDQTVIADEGLVGRVVSAGRSTAVVVLAVDRGAVVGARLGSNREIGYLRGSGDMGAEGRLSLDFVDDAVRPARGDVVVTWGSRGGAPYVGDIPIGLVTDVVSTPRQLSQHAAIKPFVDFSSLDVVGVVVPEGTAGDRPVIGAAQDDDPTGSDQ